MTTAIIRVAGQSRAAAVAGAIAGVIRQHRHAQIQAIGASAVHQAMKAIILARAYLADEGMDLVLVPEFVEVEVNTPAAGAVSHTALRFDLRTVSRADPTELVPSPVALSLPVPLVENTLVLTVPISVLHLLDASLAATQRTEDATEAMIFAQYRDELKEVLGR